MCRYSLPGVSSRKYAIAAIPAIAIDPPGDVRAFDVETGKELWKYKLPAGGKATPMTYLGADGRQYVTVSAGGDGKSWGKADSVVTFALPKAK